MLSLNDLHLNNYSYSPPLFNGRRERRERMGSIAGDDVCGGGGGGKEEERILVSVRVRPLNVKEIERSEVSDWECINSNTLIFKNSVNPSAFTFDRVFGCDSSTKEVYEEGAKEVALSVVSGINSSIFAYGQTSSGKTYTMSGITEYSVSEIYEYIHKHEEREFVLKFSAMEIYNESVKDLLNPDIGPLRLLDDPEKGTVVDKLTEETLRDEEHLRELLSFCEAERQIGETYLNELSSRSHQILRLSIESSAKEFYGKDNFSTLSASVNFVDLAGSERASQALTAGSRLKEGCHINRSLLTLGTVIRKLSKGRNGHVPYRDSKLTRILQSSLGGNARTAIICTMSPARSHIEQSKNTLQFASCAKEVATNAHVNIVMSDKALVKKLRRELARLEEELRYMGSASSTVPSDILREKDAQIKKMENEMKEILQQRDLAQSRLDDLLRVVENDQHSGQLEFCQSSISHASHSYEDTLSISEESGITYQIPVNETPSFDENESGAVNQISVNETPSFDEQESGGTYQSPFSEAPSLDENCEEVRCIEMIEPSLNSIEDFSLLQTEDSDSRLPPAVNSHKHSDQEPPLLLTLERENQKPLIIDAQGRGFLRERVALAKSTKLRKSRSCRASLMTTGTSSPWFEELEEIENTPPSKLFKDLSKLPRGLRKTIAPVRYEQSGHGSDNNEADTNDDVLKPKNTKNPSDGNTMRLSGYGLEKEEENANDDVLKQKNTKNSPDGNTMRLSMSVDGLKEVAHIQYQKELADDQDCGIKITIKDVGLDPVLESAESPMRWKLEFEKKQREIVELWNTCNVSLIHRSYFFLLIKGEPADAIYMEVEHRRLNFLRNSSSQGSLEENANRELSLNNLRREREKLSRLMKRLPVAERESLYTKWDIALDSKQRRNQLCRRLWNDTIDMEHAKESAMLVAKLFGFIEPGPVPKELFGLSFTPKMSPRNSFSCMYR